MSLAASTSALERAVQAGLHRDVNGLNVRRNGLEPQPINQTTGQLINLSVEESPRASFNTDDHAIDDRITPLSRRRPRSVRNAINQSMNQSLDQSTDQNQPKIPKRAQLRSWSQRPRAEEARIGLESIARGVSAGIGGEDLTSLINQSIKQSNKPSNNQLDSQLDNRIRSKTIEQPINQTNNQSIKPNTDDERWSASETDDSDRQSINQPINPSIKQRSGTRFDRFLAKAGKKVGRMTGAFHLKQSDQSINPSNNQSGKDIMSLNNQSINQTINESKSPLPDGDGSATPPIKSTSPLNLYVDPSINQSTRASTELARASHSLRNARPSPSALSQLSHQSSTSQLLHQSNNQNERTHQSNNQSSNQLNKFSPIMRTIEDVSATTSMASSRRSSIDPINQPINQSINRSIDQTINQALQRKNALRQVRKGERFETGFGLENDQSVGHSSHEQSDDRSSNQVIDRSNNQSNNQSVDSRRIVALEAHLQDLTSTLDSLRRHGVDPSISHLSNQSVDRSLHPSLSHPSNQSINQSYRLDLLEKRFTELKRHVTDELNQLKVTVDQLNRDRSINQSNNRSIVELIVTLSGFFIVGLLTVIQPISHVINSMKSLFIWNKHVDDDQTINQSNKQSNNQSNNQTNYQSNNQSNNQSSYQSTPPVISSEQKRRREQRRLNGRITNERSID